MRAMRPSSMARLTTTAATPGISMRSAGAPLMTKMPMTASGAAGGELREQPGHGGSAFDRAAGGRSDPTTVGDEDHVGRQDVEEALEVAALQGGEELLDGLFLVGPAHLHAEPAGSDVVTGPAGDLAPGRRRLAGGRGDLA
jgi:hypothetical protein